VAIRNGSVVIAFCLSADEDQGVAADLQRV
jgi:hypothetical protein